MYFAVKATPNPFILSILKEEGCGTDCSSLTELMLSDKCGFSGQEIMFSSNETPAAEYELAVNETRTGDLVFDVPADEKDFSISTMELFDDGSLEGEEGDTFFVFFSAEAK